VAEADDDLAADVAGGEGGQALGRPVQRQDGGDVDGEGAGLETGELAYPTVA
jgi:hypothetical protein